MSDHETLKLAIRSLRENLNRTNIEWRDLTKMVCDAAESTLPKTKMTEVWHVEHCELGTPYVMVVGDAVIARARALALSKQTYTSCIRVTGPHQQEVPA